MSEFENKKAQTNDYLTKLLYHAQNIGTPMHGPYVANITATDICVDTVIANNIYKECKCNDKNN